jgi:predicted RNase H-like nuclease (RuvC/YqgF family)
MLQINSSNFLSRFREMERKNRDMTDEVRSLKSINEELNRKQRDLQSENDNLNRTCQEHDRENRKLQMEIEHLKMQLKVGISRYSPSF